MLVTDLERRTRMTQLLLAHGAQDNLLGRSAIWEGEKTPAALESDTQALMRTARLHGYRLEDRIALEPSTEYAELHEACALGDLKAVQKWIDNNPGRTVDFTPIVVSNSGRLYDHQGGTATDVTTSVDLDVHAASENTGLAYAASHGQLAVCNILLKNGADPNHVNRNGATPLHYACFRQNREIVRLLLQYGGGKSVDVSGVSTLWDCKMTPLQLTQETGKVSYEIERALKQSVYPNREWVPVTAIQ
ncbi:hypothetical protein CYMTET_28191 [Cymbomonas tetramitiformis]|uniref:Uncharacterized protein n=1 Tax=Cymbomonas tetramitiformis TaxID=36881 RepID=A0AAE0KW60_9CHLO|nr:hypothetical protein CYMTET_28191 [Cymbomonas tetramitiformis]